MEHMLTKANIIALANTLGTYGIYFRTQVINHQYSATRSEATLKLDKDTFLPVVRMVIDSETASVTVVTADKTIEVSSYHNNGSGPFLRTSDSEGRVYEFVAIEHDTISWFHKDGLGSSWSTPAGELRAEREENLTKLKNEIKALRAEFCPEPAPTWVV